MEAALAVGILLVVIGMLIIAISAASGKVEFSFAGMIGPVPVVFGNSPRALVIALLLLAAALVLYFLH